MALKSSLSAGLHNIISNRPPATERLLTLFLITVISLMSVAMLTVMTEGLEADLRTHYVESNTQKAINLAQQIDRFINTRRIQLEDQAKHAIVQQTVMRPDSNQGLIGDFFSGQTIVGKQYTQQIFDFRGERIFSSTHIGAATDADLESHPKAETFYQKHLALYQKKRAFSVGLGAQNQFWEIALPIHYGQSVEGILLTYIPVRELVEALNLNNVLDVRLKATTGEGQSLRWGEPSDQQWQAGPVGQSSLTLHYAIDMSSMASSFDSARNRLVVSALVIAVIAIGFAIVMGRWFFVRPLQNLQAFAVALSEGADPHLEKTKRITIEIQELSDRITDMAQKIHRREQALIKTNETLKHNQETLVHAEKMAGLGQVTAGVAHEINNPIGFIMNNLSMLREYHQFLKKLTLQLIDLRQKLPASAQDQLKSELDAIEQTLSEEDLDFVINDLDCITDESAQGAVRVRDITQALKGYAYSGEQSTPTDINECIESTLKMVWNELKYNSKVEKDLGMLPLVDCMGGQINQVFMNLFVNASHAMEGSQGVLSIKTEQQDAHIVVTISDTGHGIKPEHLNHIFEPFFTTKAVGQGTGLGMSICYDIIKKHGGEIEVKSTVGMGTTFTITLPIAHTT